MGFFKELEQTAPGLKLTLHITNKDGVFTVSVLPDGVKGLKSLDIKGTADELDEGFFGAIKEPIGAVGLVVANLQEFKTDLQKKAEEAKEDAEDEMPAKPAAKKGGAKKSSTAAKKAAPTPKNVSGGKEKPKPKPEKEASTSEEIAPVVICGHSEEVKPEGPRQHNLF